MPIIPAVVAPWLETLAAQARALHAELLAVAAVCDVSLLHEAAVDLDWVARDLGAVLTGQEA